MRKLFAVVAIVMMGFISVSSAFAASTPTGSIDLVNTPPVKYGDTVSFTTSTHGKFTTRAYDYVNVVCLQNGKVVYQASGAVSSSFVLSDQSGDGLDWNGGAANCVGSLVYRIDYQKGSSITYLDQVNFGVQS